MAEESFKTTINLLRKRMGRIPDRELGETDALEWARHTLPWSLFPHSYGTEADGSHVIFDEWHRPICRKRANGKIEVLYSNTKIELVTERPLYGAEGPGGSVATVKHCLELVERLGIREEIEYRKAIVDAHGLPGGWLL